MFSFKNQGADPLHIIFFMQYLLVKLYYIYIFTMFKKHKNKIKDIKVFPDHAFSGLRYFGYGLSIGVSKNGLHDLLISKSFCDWSSIWRLIITCAPKGTKCLRKKNNFVLQFSVKLICTVQQLLWRGLIWINSPQKWVLSIRLKNWGPVYTGW